MCLILVAWRHHRDFPLVIAANRDEFHARATLPADFWPQHPQLCAGRDLQAGGTWLGVARNGRFAAVTNRRSLAPPPPAALSRGALARDFLLTDLGAEAYAASLRRNAGRYAGFNLLTGELGKELVYLGDADAAPRRLEPGLYGLSNDRLDTPWPKVEGAREALSALLRAEPEPESILALLADRTLAPDHELPDTGVGLERERLLGPRFICTPAYGTRASTCVRAHRDGWVEIVERSFGADGSATATVVRRFAIA